MKVKERKLITSLKVSNNVTGLQLLEDRIKANNDIECEIKENTLIVKGSGSGSMIITQNGSMTIQNMNFSNGYCSGNGTIETDVVSINSDKIILKNDKKKILFRTKKGDVDITKVIQDYIKNQKVSEDIIELDDRTTFYFKDFNVDYLISSISVSGSGKLSMKAKELDTENLNVSISGSGDVLLPAMTIGNVVFSVAGSGDIVGSNTNINSGSVNVTGSGDIKNLHFLKSVSANVVGSGDIHISCSKDCKRNKNVIGSGDISIKKK
jgi:hypothetical protein